ncbi:MAG: hypothetical protein ACI9PN_002748, partial [Candidatus Azotimanducaceae bacterium]
YPWASLNKAASLATKPNELIGLDGVGLPSLPIAAGRTKMLTVCSCILKGTIG